MCILFLFLLLSPTQAIHVDDQALLNELAAFYPGVWPGTDCGAGGRIICDAQSDRVLELRTGALLLGNAHNGDISPAFGRFTALTVLQLQLNNFTGTVPQELGNLKSLTFLRMYGNPLSGSLPAELGGMSSIVNFWLYETTISGTIPPELGQWTTIASLRLHGNHFEGPVPQEFENFQQLTELSLYYTGVSGPLPEWSAMPSLVVLDLHNTAITGPLPKFGQHPLLGVLRLYNNPYLDGPIPGISLSQLHNLVELWLHGNQLSGTIPGVLAAITTLEELYLGSNHLTGTIPDAFGEFQAIRELTLGGNWLSGTVPASLQGLGLQVLHLLPQDKYGFDCPLLLYSRFAPNNDYDPNGCRLPEETTPQNSQQSSTLIIILAGVFGLFVLLCAWGKHVNPEAKNGQLISVALSLMDTLADVFFAVELIELDHSLQWYCVAFIAGPVFLSLVLCSLLFISERKQNKAFATWTSTRENEVYLVLIVCATNLEILNLFDSKIFNWDLFNAPWRETTKLRLPLVMTLSPVLEDLPQFVIQVMFLLSSGDKPTGFAVIALVTTLIRVVFGGFLHKCFLWAMREKTLSDDKNPGQPPSTRADVEFDTRAEGQEA
jgi:Leucine-rich repeat (LRR) protein